jgi:dihydroneopterin triphosphate aldolase (PTPS-III) / 6-pyruvoyltetrahydropterin synthase
MSLSSSRVTSFEVHVTKEDFKFHAAHFVAFEGYRERLHGHNYKCGVRLHGSRQIASDGYVVDFGDVKKAVRIVCKQLNEHFICPTLSDVLTIVTEGEDSNDSDKESVTLTCQDGSVFKFPRNDCAMLPIVHATAEELAIYLWSRILEGLDPQKLLKRGVHTMEVIVAEAVGQEAVFRLEIPKDPNFESLDVASFIQKGEIGPTPCPSYDDKTSNEEATPQLPTTTISNSSEPQCCDGCMQSLSVKLEQLAKAMNEQPNGKPVTAEDIKKILGS